MKRKALTLILVLILMLMGTGCVLNPKLQLLQPPGDLKNYALQSNGAKILVGREKENSHHPIESLINGNRSSEDWTQGEGWEYRYQYYQPLRDPYYYNPEGFSIAKIVIQFPKKIQLNRVIVYTIDNTKYPASEYGVSDLGLQYWAKGNVWLPVELTILQRKSSGRTQNNHKRVINFHFSSIRTKAIKMLVYDTNDSIILPTYKYDEYGCEKKGAIRLVEIEAYGTEVATIPRADDEHSLEQLFSMGDAK